MRGLTALSLLVVGCHLIGGAGDLEFRDAGGSANGGAGGAGAAAGGNGGAPTCEATCMGECESCDLEGMEDTCAPLPVSTECTDGLCDGAHGCATGAPLWARIFGDTEDSRAEGIAVSGEDVVIVGTYQSDGGAGFSLDEEPLDNAANLGDLFVAKLNRATGEAAWAVSAGSDDDSQSLSSVAIDGDGNVVVAGKFKQQITHSGWATVNSNVSSGPTTYYDTIFVGKLGPAGIGVWSYAPLNATFNHDAQRASDIAVAADGTVAIAGQYDSRINVTSGQEFGVGAGAPNGVVIVLEAAGAAQAGEVRWAFNVGTYDYADATGAAFDENGALWVVGQYNGQSGGFTLPLPGIPNSIINGFIVRFTATDGTPELALSLGTTQADDVHPRAIVAIPDGLVIAGTFEGTLNLLGGNTASEIDGNPDIFVAELALDGSCRWLRHVVATAASSVDDMIVDSAGQITVVGSFTGGLNFGEGNVVGSGGTPQAFVFKLDLSGTYLWSRNAGGSGTDAATGIAADADRALYLSGLASDVVPPSTDMHGGGEDILVMQLAP